MNVQTIHIAINYVDKFCELFQKTNEGKMDTTSENLLKIEKWFNESNMLIGLITGIQPVPLNFDLDLGTEHEKNQKILVHIYSLSYTCVLRLSKIVKSEIPEEFSPIIGSIQF